MSSYHPFKSGSQYITNGLISTFNSNTLGNLYTTGGNIGINTPTPAYTLDVNGNINANGYLTAASIGVSGITTGTVYTTSVISTNSSLGNVNSSGLTTGNINFTGSLYQNGVAYVGSQWTSTSGNVSYTSGSVVVTNMISTNNSIGTLTVTGLTAGNINFTGSLYKNGSLYSASSVPVYAIYSLTGNTNNGNSASYIALSGSLTSGNTISGLSFNSSTGWTNTSGSSLAVQVTYNLIGNSLASNSYYLNAWVQVNTTSNVLVSSVYCPSGTATTCNGTGIVVLNNGDKFNIMTYGNIYGTTYPLTTYGANQSTIYISLLH